MSKEKTIIKNLNSIQNLGSMEILCTDKTGTLTQDKVVLLYHLNIHGKEDVRVLRHAFLNSYYQTGLKNLMDIAIIDRVRALANENTTGASATGVNAADVSAANTTGAGATGATGELRGLAERFSKVDEIPFDFERRRMSVVVKNSKIQMITKGAVEEMLSICSFAEYEGKVQPLTDELKRYLLNKVDELNQEGMRVIAVAQKTSPSPVGKFSVAEEFGGR